MHRTQFAAISSLNVPRTPETTALLHHPIDRAFGKNTEHQASVVPSALAGLWRYGVSDVFRNAVGIRDTFLTPDTCEVAAFSTFNESPDNPHCAIRFVPHDPVATVRKTLESDFRSAQAVHDLFAERDRSNRVLFPRHHQNRASHPGETDTKVHTPLLVVRPVEMDGNIILADGSCQPGRVEWLTLVEESLLSKSFRNTATESLLQTKLLSLDY